MHVSDGKSINYLCLRPQSKRWDWSFCCMSYWCEKLEKTESFPFDEPWCNFGIINRVENRRRKLFHQENHTKVQRIRSSLNVTASLNSFIRISETETEKINWNLYLIKRPSWQKARWPVETWLRRLEVYCCLSMDKVKSKKLLQASTTRAGFVESGWVEE